MTMALTGLKRGKLERKETSNVFQPRQVLDVEQTSSVHQTSSVQPVSSVKS
jgi:hypothetical protein